MLEVSILEPITVSSMLICLYRQFGHHHVNLWYRVSPPKFLSIDFSEKSISGAACEAALEGIPSAAFSGDSTAQVSYTTLESDPTSKASLAASIYASLTVKFVQALLGNSTSSILPKGISLNVNYPATDNCPDVADFHFVLSRIESNSGATDVQTCGSHHLPAETSVIDTSGCYSSVSVFNASTKSDVDAATQSVVLNKLSGILTCLPS
jgi:5'-nucleotidase